MTSPAGTGLAHVADVLDALQAGALLVDDAGRIIHANPRFCEMVARPAAELIGLDLRELYLKGPGREQVAQFVQDSGVAREMEFFLPLPDGRELPVVVSGRPPPVDSPLSSCRVVTVIDISGLKAAGDRLREQYRQIALLSDTVLEQALELKDHSKTLERRVHQRTQALREANMEAIYMLAVACEAKDDDTGAHVLRIRDYATALARQIGSSDGDAERIGHSAILHDVGKIHVADSILKKPGPLTPEERRQMEVHSVAGERILSDKPFFDVARQIARHHQENWDGSGYPDGLVGSAIPLAARITRLADVYDALVSARPYKPPWPPEKATLAIREYAGTWFDPELVQAFGELVESGEWVAIRARQRD